MNLYDHLARARSFLRSKRGLEPSPYFSISEHRIGEVGEAHRHAEAATSDLARMTFGHTGRVVDKWTHYLDHYDRHFSRFRNTQVKMLEIGVFKGGSLEIWREYFGPDATIFGVDINPECADLVTQPNQVRIGSQADPDFLLNVVEEMGGVDIVLDDGSHIAPHQRASFETLWPMLSDKGIYAVEDVHTAYWPGGYEGGYRRSGSAIEFGKTVVDDMHGWYHAKGEQLVRKDEVDGVHFYDSIFFIDKKKSDPPMSVRLPLGAPITT